MVLSTFATAKSPIPPQMVDVGQVMEGQNVTLSWNQHAWGEVILENLTEGILVLNFTGTVNSLFFWEGEEIGRLQKDKDTTYLVQLGPYPPGADLSLRFQVAPGSQLKLSNQTGELEVPEGGLYIQGTTQPTLNGFVAEYRLPAKKGYSLALEAQGAARYMGTVDGSISLYGNVSEAGGGLFLRAGSLTGSSTIALLCDQPVDYTINLTVAQDGHGGGGVPPNPYRTITSDGVMVNIEVTEDEFNQYAGNQYLPGELEVKSEVTFGYDIEVGEFEYNVTTYTYDLLLVYEGDTINLFNPGLGTNPVMGRYKLEHRNEQTSATQIYPLEITATIEGVVYDTEINDADSDGFPTLTLRARDLYVTHNGVNLSVSEGPSYALPGVIQPDVASSDPVIPNPTADMDGEGLSTLVEVFYTATDPLNADSDGDGTPDGQESYDDSDGDGLLDSTEAILGTDAFDRDSDDDYFEDGAEYNYWKSRFGSNRVGDDLDGDGLSYLLDSDSDLAYNGTQNTSGYYQFTYPNFTWPASALEGVKFNELDGTELLTLNTDPALNDTDGDGLDDGAEALYWSTQGYGYENLNTPDSDGDGLEDGYEMYTVAGLYNLANYFQFMLSRDIWLNYYSRYQNISWWEAGNYFPFNTSDYEYAQTLLDSLADGLWKPLDKLLPASNDTDGDGVSDWWEAAMGYPFNLNASLKGAPIYSENQSLSNATLFFANPLLNDTDFDGFMDLSEMNNNYNPALVDSDYDLLPDPIEDANQNFIHDNATNETHPLMWDTDGDLMDDGWEVYWGLDPLLANGGDDPDNDGYDFDKNSTIWGWELYTNLEEYENSTRPIDPDPDNDSLPDGWEVFWGLDPFEYEKSSDPDNDLLENWYEYVYGANPLDADSDDDGLRDDKEVLDYYYLDRIEAESGFINISNTYPPNQLAFSSGFPYNMSGNGMLMLMNSNESMQLPYNSTMTFNYEIPYSGTYKFEFVIILFTNYTYERNGEEIEVGYTPEGLWLNATSENDTNLRLSYDKFPIKKSEWNYENVTVVKYQYNFWLILKAEIYNLTIRHEWVNLSQPTLFTDYINIYKLGLDPWNNDTDFDLVPDGIEVNNTLDPLNPDSDNDGILDFDEVVFDEEEGIISWFALDSDVDDDGVIDGIDLEPTGYWDLEWEDKEYTIPAYELIYNTQELFPEGNQPPEIGTTIIDENNIKWEITKTQLNLQKEIDGVDYSLYSISWSNAENIIYDTHRVFKFEWLLAQNASNQIRIQVYINPNSNQLSYNDEEMTLLFFNYGISNSSGILIKNGTKRADFDSSNVFSFIVNLESWFSLNKTYLLEIEPLWMTINLSSNEPMNLSGVNDSNFTISGIEANAIANITKIWINPLINMTNFEKPFEIYDSTLDGLVYNYTSWVDINNETHQNLKILILRYKRNDGEIMQIFSDIATNGTFTGTYKNMSYTNASFDLVVLSGDDVEIFDEIDTTIKWNGTYWLDESAHEQLQIEGINDDELKAIKSSIELTDEYVRYLAVQQPGRLIPISQTTYGAKLASWQAWAARYGTAYSVTHVTMVRVQLQVGMMQSQQVVKLNHGRAMLFRGTSQPVLFEYAGVYTETRLTPFETVIVQKVTVVGEAPQTKMYVLSKIPPNTKLYDSLSKGLNGAGAVLIIGGTAWSIKNYMDAYTQTGDERYRLGIVAQTMTGGFALTSTVVQTARFGAWVEAYYTGMAFEGTSKVGAQGAVKTFGTIGRVLGGAAFWGLGIYEVYTAGDNEEQKIRGYLHIVDGFIVLIPGGGAIEAAVFLTTFALSAVGLMDHPVTVTELFYETINVVNENPEMALVWMTVGPVGTLVADNMGWSPSDVVDWLGDLF